jgi:hypothetical protein
MQVLLLEHDVIIDEHPCHVFATSPSVYVRGVQGWAASKVLADLFDAEMSIEHLLVFCVFAVGAKLVLVQPELTVEVEVTCRMELLQLRQDIIVTCRHHFRADNFVGLAQIPCFCTFLRVTAARMHPLACRCGHEICWETFRVSHGA